MAQVTVGFLGLGFMGHGMATNIMAQGFPMVAMAHRRREAIEDLVTKGAHEASDLAALATASDVIVLCVTGAEQVDALIRGPVGIAAHARAGTVIIDCTTSRPDTIRALESDFPELIFMDAPLGRSPKEAWEGKLSVMVGASDETLARVRPVLESFTDTIQHVGPLGSGHSLKLVNNLVSMGYAALYSEALVLARANGVSPEAFDALISSSRMDCAFFQTFMGWVRSGDATSHKFALSVADHTMQDIRAEAEASGLDLGVVRAASDLYVAAVEEGAGSANLPELPRTVAARNGITLREP